MNKNKPNPMDPHLMKAFSRGRSSGHKEGKVEGLASMMSMFSEWTETLDEIKGVGPETKQKIQVYFAEKIKNAVEKKKISEENAKVLEDNIGHK